MKPFISLLICFAASSLSAWEAPKCPKNLVKFLPAGETYWCHGSKGSITALATRFETENSSSHHMILIDEAANKVYQVYESRNNGVLERMWNYEIFDVRVISRNEIEYSVEDAGCNMIYHISWNDKEKKYIQVSSRLKE